MLVEKLIQQKVTTTTVIVPGTIITDHSRTRFTVRNCFGAALTVHFGTEPSEQSVAAPDLRELARVFNDLAAFLEEKKS